MSRTPTCVWRISDELVAALDGRFGDPVDASVPFDTFDGDAGVWKVRYPVGTSELTLGLEAT